MVLLCERWVGGWTELQHIDPHSYGHNSVSFPFSWAAQPGAWGPSLSGTYSSFQHLISNWLNFLCTELYNSSTSTFFLWASQIALIQPVHGQGYILIFLDRMHLLFTQVHFLFWQLGRVGGQYTTFWPWKKWIEWPNDWMTWLIKFVIYTLVVEQKIVLLRVLQFKRVDISWPIRFVYLLICFRA